MSEFRSIRRHLLLCAFVFAAALLCTAALRARTVRAEDTGSCVYDEATHTYTMTDYKSKSTFKIRENTTIIVNGNCEVMPSSDTGIYLQGSSSLEVTIKGTGTLTCSSIMTGSAKLTIQGVTIVTKADPGMNGGSDLHVENAVLDFQEGSLQETSATFVNSSISCNNMPGVSVSNLTASGSTFRMKHCWLSAREKADISKLMIQVTEWTSMPNLYIANAVIRDSVVELGDFSDFEGDDGVTFIDTKLTVDADTSAPLLYGAPVTFSGGTALLSNRRGMGISVSALTVKDNAQVTVKSEDAGPVIDAGSILVSHAGLDVEMTNPSLQIPAIGAKQTGNESNTIPLERITLTNAAVTAPANAEYRVIEVAGSKYLTVCEKGSETGAKHVKIEVSHAWDGGTVTKQPTTAETGVKTFTCTVCGAKKTEVIPKLTPADDESGSAGDPAKQMGKDGTAFGPGASAKAADKAITSLPNDNDPKGTQFAPLKLKSAKQTNTSVTISWSKAKGAKKYVIYANKCGRANKMKKLATVTGTSKAIKKVAGAKVKKGTYYKFMLVALDGNNKVISTSKMIHAATKGGKIGNHKAVTVSAKVNKNGKALKKYTKTSAIALKKGKRTTLKASGTIAVKGTKVKNHVKMRYESSNPKIATVTKKGVVKGVKKGSCSVYVYAQDGVAKKIKVKVS